MKFSKKNKRRLIKTLILNVSLLIAICLCAHVFVAPKVHKLEIVYTADSVYISLYESITQIPNILIERDGIPGSMVFYEGIMIIAFPNPGSYWREKSAQIIWGEPDEGGVIIGIKPVLVTSGTYAAEPYEFAGNREHVPDSGGKVFLVDVRDNALFYWKSNRIIW